MTIHFGNDFDGPVFSGNTPLRAGELFAGPSRLLHWLEEQLGLGGYPNNTAYLRIELYRQALAQTENTFYSASYEADRFATAESLLHWRDELLAAGWSFELKSDMPPRLEAIAKAEAFYRKKTEAPELLANTKGMADRMEQVLQRLLSVKVPLDKIILYEPLDVQPPVIGRWLNVIKTQQPATVIETFEQAPSGISPELKFAVLKCRRDSDASVFLAQLLRLNPGYQPLILAPQSSLLLEHQLQSEGYPALGIPAASLARPSMQVLKLAPAFLWEPVDVFKIMEFLTLPVKPLDAGLSLEIARVMAEKPGFFSDTWFAAVLGYFENAENSEKIKAEYEFWFNRRRYPLDKTAPKKDAVSIYAYLTDWAHRFFEETGSTNTSLLVLAEQARRIRELLDTLPEQRISFLELERIVRTIFEASPIQLASSEAGTLPFIHKPGAIAAPPDELVWWNFVGGNDAAPVDKWQKSERMWLERQGVRLATPGDQSRLKQLLQMRPLLKTAKRVLLISPEFVDGVEVSPHLLLSDLEAGRKQDFNQHVYYLDQAADRSRLQQLFQLPGRQKLAPRLNQRTRPHLQISHPERIPLAEYETPTNLESLFYYPHRWFFRQKLRLFPSSLLSITNDTTLLGNVAHRIFEKLLKQDINALEKTELFKWVDAEAEQLLPKEGATLLLYGREPEKNTFLRKVKNAAWNLIAQIKSNGWLVEETEKDLQGEIQGVQLRGKADLVLSRGAEQAIIDLKWSGARRRKELILNGEDLQLVLYARLLPPESNWPHTAYFILEDGKLIARNAAAFQEAVQAGRGLDHMEACSGIFERMLKTFEWRMEQISNGLIEIRTARTAVELESMYEGRLFELLEMKNEEARWDDYRILIS